MNKDVAADDCNCIIFIGNSFNSNVLIEVLIDIEVNVFEIQYLIVDNAGAVSSVDQPPWNQITTCYG